LGEQKTGGRRKWRVWAVAGVALAALVVWALTRWGSQFEWSRFADTFRHLDPWWLALSGFLALLTYVGRALRWQVLIKSQSAHTSFKRIFSATVIGFTAIMLFGRPGELVRPYLISVRERLTFSSQVAALLLERLYDLAMALLIFGYSLSGVKTSAVQVGEGLRWVLSAGGGIAGVLGLVCLAIFIGLRHFGEKSQQRVVDAISFLPDKHRASLEGVLRAFARGVESTKDWRSVILVLVYSVGEWVIITGCTYCLFRAFPQAERLSANDILIFLGFVSFGGVVQIPGVGGGVQIVSVMVLTQLFGMPFEEATSIAVVLWAVTWLIVVPLGLIFAFMEGVTWSNLRHIEQPAGGANTN
jgi:uncharacterized protein (TIRG00374 family)